MEKERSVGIIIVGWLYIIGAVGNFIMVLLFTFSNAPAEKSLSIFHKVGIKPYDPLIWIGLVFLGRALLKLQNWARITSIVLNSLACLAVPISFLIKKSLTFGQWVGIVIAIFILFYLTRPEVKEQFK